MAMIPSREEFEQEAFLEWLEHLDFEVDEDLDSMYNLFTRLHVGQTPFSDIERALRVMCLEDPERYDTLLAMASAIYTALEAGGVLL